jgi:replicative DNA helicase
MITNDQLIKHEQAVIGSILVKNDGFDDIKLKPHEFFVGSHRIIYTAMCEFLNAGKPVDLILLAGHLSKKGTLESVGDMPYIGALVENAVSMRTVKSHAKHISEAHQLRKWKELFGTLNDIVDGNQSVVEIKEAVESGLTDMLEAEEQENNEHFSKSVADAVDCEEQDKKGLSTGLRDLDWMTNGFKNGELVIIAGRPSMGKSTLACQIAEHVAIQESVQLFSLEMTNRQVASRALKFHESRVGKSQAILHLSSLKYHVDQSPAVTIGYIRSRCRTTKRKHGLSMIVVDYIQLMRGEGENRTQEIGSISRGLKEIAKEFDIPVIALSQLNRKVDDRTDKRPVMSDLRESGEIEQDADVVLFIYRDEVYNQDSQDKGQAEIICRKNRNGSIGDVTTTFNGELTRFSDFNGQRILRSVNPTKKSFEYSPHEPS